MTSYELLRLTHISCVAISVVLFTYRYLRLAMYPARQLPKPLKVFPHINDSVLLAAAIGMLLLIGLNPLQAPWLAAKILALFLYIALGALCLRARPGSRHQAVLFVGAIAVFTYILLVAVMKQSIPGYVNPT